MHSLRGNPHLPPALILLCTCIWIPLALQDGGYGVTWDEPWYVQAGAFYTGLWDATRAGLPSAWIVNHEHPPLAKMFMGLGEWTAAILLPQHLDAVLIGARATVMLLFGLLLVGVWTLCVPLGRLTAALAVLFCMACPRLTGHAQLATLDLPLACLWVWCLAAVARALPPTACPGSSDRRVWGFAALSCLFAGCAFLTKFSGLVLLAVVAAWVVIQWGLARLAADHAPDVERPRLMALVWGLGLVVIMGVVAALMLLACWPWLWEHTGERLDAYLKASTEHHMCPVLYLGTVYGAKWSTDAPPWHYAPVMLFITMPAVVALGTVLDLGFSAARWKSAFTETRVLVLVILGAAALPAATMLPGGVAYDGVRLFLPTVPLLCVLTAHGWARFGAWLADKADGPRKKMVLALGVPLILALGSALFARLAVRDELAYYTPAIGGPPGAHAMGMETCYWATGLTREAIREGPKAVRLRDDDTQEKRVRFIGFGSVTPLFLHAIGWLPENVKVTEGTDWHVAWQVNRLSLWHSQGLLVPAASDHAQAEVWPFEPVTTIWVTWGGTP